MSKNKKSKTNKKNMNELSSLIEKAGMYFEKSNYTETIAVCRKAIDDYRDQAETNILAKLYFTWVLAMMRMGNYNDIDKIITQAKNQIGQYLDLTFMEVMSAYGMQDWRKTIELAERFYEEHTRVNPSEDSYLNQSYNSRDEILWIGVDAAKKINDKENAIKFSEIALQANPDNQSKRFDYANYLADLNEFDKSIKIIDEGIERDNNKLALKNARGYLLSKANRLVDAEEYIKGILKEHPDNVDALNNLGVVYDSLGNYDLALEYFNKALKIEPGNTLAKDNIEKLTSNLADKKVTISAAMIVKNEEKFLPGCLESIKELVDEIIIVDTGSTDRTMDIAREYGAKIYEHPWQNDFSFHRNQSIDYSTGDWVLIVDADEELDPEEHNIIKQLVKRKDINAISFVVFNKIQSGRVGFLNSVRMFRNGNNFKYEGIVHNQLHVSGKIYTSHLKVIHHGYGLSDEQMKQKGRRSEALLLKQIEEDPNAIFPHFNLAQLYRGLDEPEKSLHHAGIAAERVGPNSTDHPHIFLMSLDQMGCAYLALEEYDKAEDTLKKALEYRKDYLDPLFNLGVLYMRLNRKEDALNVFTKFLEAKSEYRPENEDMGLILNNLQSEHIVYYCLGTIYLAYSNYNKALEYYNKTLLVVDDLEYLHHFMGRCYRRSGEYKKVLYHCARAIEFGKEDLEIKILEGEAYLNLGEIENAKQSFNRALEIDPESDSAKVGLLGVTSLNSNSEDLLKLIDEFLEKSPNSPQTLASKGDVLFHMNSYQSAKISYKKSMEGNPDDYKVLNNLGNCFLKEGNFASAEFYYLNALKINNGFLAGYRNLAVALINQQKYSDAAEYLEYYIQENSMDKEVHATLGDLYYKDKNYTKAILHFEKFIQNYPSNMDAIIRLSDCYFNLGRIAAAAAGYNAVLNNQPANEIAKQRLKDLNAFLQPTDRQ